MPLVSEHMPATSRHVKTPMMLSIAFAFALVLSLTTTLVLPHSW